MSNKCDSCNTDLKTHASIYIGLGQKSLQHLCFSCYNEMMADYLDIDFETIAFDDIDLEDKDGVKHRFSFYTHIAGDKVGMEAIEQKDDDSSGYQFYVISDVEEDLLILYKNLYERMKRGLSQKHIEESDINPYSFTNRDTVRGYIAYDPDNDEDNIPMVVIDGKEITWLELGKMVSIYESFNFKLEIFDKTEEK